MNRISLEKLMEIERLALSEGMSLREIAALTGVDKNTVARYYPREAKCKCGRDAGHKGWCSHRYAKSKARPAALAKAKAAQMAIARAGREMRQEAEKRGLVWRDGTWKPKPRKL